MKNPKIFFLIIQFLFIIQGKSQGYMNSVISKMKIDVLKFKNDSIIKNNDCINKQIEFIGFDSSEINYLHFFDSLVQKDKGIKTTYSNETSTAWLTFNLCDSLDILEVRRYKDKSNIINIVFVRKRYVFKNNNKLDYKEFTIYECHNNFIIIK